MNNNIENRVMSSGHNPVSGLKCVCLNARSIVNKMGELKGIGTSQTSKYVFGVFTYLSYRLHTHMNNCGA